MTDSDSLAGTAASEEQSGLPPKRLGITLLEEEGQVEGMEWSIYDWPHCIISVKSLNGELNIPLHTIPTAWTERRMTDPPPKVRITVQEIIE
jgi:hypothetical protein